MRRILKWLAVGVGALVVIALAGVGGAVLVTKRAMARTYTAEVVSVEIPAGDGELEEGRRLFSARGCADCHDVDLGGKAAIEDPGLGTLWAPNLTRGKGGVVASFQDRDWIRAIRHGLKPDGTGLLFMPSEDFFHLSDRDLGALIAFAKAAPPVDRISQPHVIKPLLYVLSAAGLFPFLSAEKIDHSARPDRVSEPAPTVGYGAYLARVQCVGCHGQGLGGGPMPGAPPSVPPPANLTPDKETGLGGWSHVDFDRALRGGTRPDGRKLDPFMPSKNFSMLNDTEVGALWAYLRSIPAKPLGSR